MATTNWLRQTKDSPLFPDLLWSRPESKQARGKLLIVGGNSHAFTAVSAAYTAGVRAGVGSATILLPDVLQKTLGKVFPEAEFAPSTPSGSFARLALAQLLELAEAGDAVLLAGDFGKNSETAILLESFAEKYAGLLALTGDSLDYFLEDPNKLLDREETTLVAGLAQLQKLLTGRLLIKHAMDLAQLVEALAMFGANCPAAIVTNHADQIVVAASGQVSTTPVVEIDFIKLAAYASVWQLQHTGKVFEAVSSAAFSYIQS